jgi:Arc/MetJ-type ribon-helix-helix transcriptional regulator
MVRKVFSVNKTYSLTMLHINKVIDMSLASGKSQSEVIREAVDLLYSKKTDLKKILDDIRQSFNETNK